MAAFMGLWACGTGAPVAQEVTGSGLFATRVEPGQVTLMAGGAGFVYRAVALPGGPAPQSLQALDGEGRVLAATTVEGGVLSLGNVPAPARLRVLAESDGTVALYANDPDDADGDGLGQKLERALGTCDGPLGPGCGDGPLAAYYKQVGTADSDRDGLPDGEEVFGVAGTPGLALPAWGADPRHKDVFVEVDWVKSLDATVLYPQDIRALAQLFAEGSADDLKNPDGKSGVRLHLDVGYGPLTQGDRGLFGDWGGAGPVKGGDFKRGNKRHMDPLRQGRFRYALAKRHGTGQSRGDGFYFNRYGGRVALFAHELGHTLGLKHHGHRAWGEANCKPHYLSLMNYLYQHDLEVGFSRSAGRELNPAHVLETWPLGEAERRALQDPPLSLEVMPAGVDWNRDGLISPEPVRAPLGWGTYKSCGELAQGRQDVWKSSASDATPVLLRHGPRLHAYWLDGDGRVLTSHKRVVRAQDGPGCGGQTFGFGASQRQTCEGWSRVSTLALPFAAHSLAGASEPGRPPVLLALDGQQRLRVLNLDGQGALAGHTLIKGARSPDRPVLSWTGPAEARHLLFMWRDPSGTLMQARTRSTGPGLQLASVVDGAGASIETPLGPALLELPWGELCGAFSDPDGFLRLYCRGAGQERWSDLSRQAFYAGLGPQTLAPPSLGFHRYRTSQGLPTAAAQRGALWLSFSTHESSREPNAPQLLVSEWLSAEYGAAARIHFPWRGPWVDTWTNMAPGTSVAMYEDAELSGLRALMLLRGTKQEASRLTFLPQADGAYDGALGDGNDFEVMERGICLGIQSIKHCGGAGTSHY